MISTSNDLVGVISNELDRVVVVAQGADDVR